MRADRRRTCASIRIKVPRSLVISRIIISIPPRSDEFTVTRCDALHNADASRPRVTPPISASDRFRRSFDTEPRHKSRLNSQTRELDAILQSTPADVNSRWFPQPQHQQPHVVATPKVTI